MNKEEKQAIKDLKNIVTDLEDAESGAIISLQQDEIDSLKIIAELIEQQQKEIEDMREELQMYVDIEENFDTVYMKAVADFKDKIKELINKRNSGIGYTSLECIEDIEKLLEE